MMKIFVNTCFGKYFNTKFVVQSNMFGGLFGLIILLWSFLKTYTPFIYSFLLTLSFMLFYLDDWKLSRNKIFKGMQIFCIVSVPVIILLLFYNIILSIGLISMAKDINGDLNLQGNISIDKEAGVAIGKGLQSVGSQIGLGATIAGVSGAVGKSIIKSPVPPIQKAAIIVGGGAAGGMIHMGVSAINRALSKGSSNTKTSINSNNINDNFNYKFSDNFNDSIPKFLVDSSDQYSDLKILILSIDGLTSICLSLVVVLFMMILFKFFLNESIKLNLSSVVGNKVNNTLQYYLVKLIKLNKMAGNIYIIAALVILFISLAFDCYFVIQLYNNLDLFVDLHINKK